MYVGLDIGYGQTKISYTSSHLGQRVDHVWPSGAAPIAKCDKVAMGGRGRSSLVSGVEIDIDGESFGALVAPERIRGGMPFLHEGYTSSREYLALYRGALTAVPGREIGVLVTGLPVEHYKHPERRKLLEDLLVGPHPIGNGRTMEVRRVVVVSQGVGAYVAADEQAEDGPSDYDTTLVVDVGHYSVDWLLFVRGGWRDTVSGSAFEGGHRVIERAVAMVEQRYGIKLGIEQLFSMVKDGVVTAPIGRSNIPVMDIIRAAAESVAPDVANSIRSRMSTQDGEVTAVILTGGGAPFYRRAIESAFSPARVIELRNPQMSNAVGYRILAEEIASQEHAA